MAGLRMMRGYAFIDINQRTFNLLGVYDTGQIIYRVLGRASRLADLLSEEKLIPILEDEIHPTLAKRSSELDMILQIKSIEPLHAPHAYTSQRCPICGRITPRYFRLHVRCMDCNLFIHRDLAACLNIAKGFLQMIPVDEGKRYLRSINQYIQKELGGIFKP